MQGILQDGIRKAGFVGSVGLMFASRPCTLQFRHAATQGKLARWEFPECVVLLMRLFSAMPGWPQPGPHGCEWRAPRHG